MLGAGAHGDRDAVRRATARSTSTRSSRSPATSSRTAPTGSSSPARPARARRSTTREARPLPGGDRGGRRPRDRRRRTPAPYFDRALGRADASRPHELGARRLPRRHAVLQQAAAARDRRALRGDRRGDRPAGRRLQHPEPRGRQHRAGDDLPARRDPEHHARSSRRTPTSTRRGTSSTRGSTSTPATTTSCPAVPRARRASAGSASTRTSSARRWPSRCARCARGRPRARPRDRRRARAGLRAARDHDEPDPDQGRAQPARPRRRRLPAAARRRRPGDELAQVRDCLARLGLLVAA